MPSFLQTYCQSTYKTKRGPLCNLLNVGHTLCANVKKESLYMSVFLPNNKEPFDAIVTTYQIFIARSFYSLLQSFVNLCPEFYPSFTEELPEFILQFHDCKI